jgi:Kef-type K+ transport system membrane component KefB
VSTVAAPKTFGTRATEAFLLALLFGTLFVATRAVPEVNGGLGAVGAVGFLLLAGTLASELVEGIGLPHLSGYILAGIVSGPHVLKLIDHETVQRLLPVNTLALSLIALAGGAELKMDLVRRGLRSLAWATLLQTVIVLVSLTGAFLAMRRFIPFTRDLGPGAMFGVALLWGVLAITRSPSALLGVLTQTRARGRLAEFSLTFVMTSDVVVIVLMTAALSLTRPLIDPGASAAHDVLGALGHEILGSVSLGTTLGLLLAAYLRLVGKHLLLVLIGIGFGLSDLLRYVHFDALLTFIVAGFVVANMTSQGDKLLHAVEQTGSVVYVVFFATAGAHLDIPLLRTMWPVALALVLCRAFATWGTARLSAKIAGDPPVLRTWGWASLVSQAGVALGLAGIVANEFPTIGAGFRALAVAAVALNELAGPVLFKLALDRAGESQRGAEREIASSH